jgi:predicted phosphohydrolase
MPVWAIADPHLSFGVPNKSMEAFGAPWVGYIEKMQRHWVDLISPEDLVLIAGDISWAMRVEEAIPDLEWLNALPGTKVMIKGNHDYWWESKSKVQKALPPSLHIIQNDAFNWGDVSVAGVRLWDTPEYGFKQYIDYVPNKVTGAAAMEVPDTSEEAERIFLRDLGRLETSLKCLNPHAKKRLVMTHYPPIGADLCPSRTSALLEKYNVDVCVFGHLHNVRRGEKMFGEKDGVAYFLTACDYLDFKPVKVVAGF